MYMYLHGLVKDIHVPSEHTCYMYLHGLVKDIHVHVPSVHTQCTCTCTCTFTS